MRKLHKLLTFFHISLVYFKMKEIFEISKLEVHFLTFTYARSIVSTSKIFYS